MPLKRIVRAFVLFCEHLQPVLLWKVPLNCGKNHSQVRQGAHSWLILLVREQPGAGTRIAPTNSRFV